MRLESVGAQHTNFHAMNRQEMVVEAKVDSSEDDDRKLKAKSRPEKGAHKDGDAKGVIGLLQKGHFKGVAELRLRINFQDKLEELEQREMAELVEGRGEDLMEMVEEKVAGILESGMLSEEQAEGVEELAETFFASVKDLLGGDKGQPGALVADIESAFEEFITPLQQSLAPPVPDQDAGAGEPGDEPLAFVEDLKASFNSALNSLAEEVNNLSVLPELSEPRGHGAAYEKFLSIYRAMQGEEPAAPDPQEAAPVAVDPVGVKV